MQLANALCRYWEMAQAVDTQTMAKKRLAQALG
jgi:hypothetical protein